MRRTLQLSTVNSQLSFELYCQWYYATAKQHPQALQKMQGDLNIFAWFRREPKN